MKKICLHDPTLRDGNHAVNHQISLNQMTQYIQSIDKTGIDVIEVGHGLGLGASSLQLGFSQINDDLILDCAREHIKHAKLGVHITPGYGKKNDLKKALAKKVDVIRIAAHCSEADITETFVKFLLDSANDVEVYVALTMSHMLTVSELLKQALLVETYGAKGIILMDSAGAYMPQDVADKIQSLKQQLKIAVGFHAHNNLGLAVSNSLQAVLSGADIIDGTSKGFGAGSGNTPLEVIVAVLQKLNYCKHIDLATLLSATEESCKYLVNPFPQIKATNIMSGMYGVFCGFDKKVQHAAEKFKLEALSIYEQLGKQKVIAGQEDKIIEVAYQLKEVSNL